MRLIPDPRDPKRYWVSYKPKAVEAKPVSHLALRPASGGAPDSESSAGGRGFASIVGQERAIQRLKGFVDLYSQSGKPPAHVLLTGVDGIGKRTLARAFAAEYCGKPTEKEAGSLVFTGRLSGITCKNDLLGILTNLAEGDALLIKDIARIPNNVRSPLVVAIREFRVDMGVDKERFATDRTRCHSNSSRGIATARSKAECPFR